MELQLLAGLRLWLAAGRVVKLSYIRAVNERSRAKKVNIQKWLSLGSRKNGKKGGMHGGRKPAKRRLSRALVVFSCLVGGRTENFDYFGR